MRSVLLLLIGAICWTPVTAAYNCTACDKRICPPNIFPCPRNRAIDPCGCCYHCAKQKLDPCGGPDWELGYCDSGLECFGITGRELVEIPNRGICRDGKLKEYFEDDDVNCPVHQACYQAMGMCDCGPKRTCILDFFQYSALRCNPKYDSPDYEHLFEYKCTTRGCDIVDDQCVCVSAECDRKFEYKDSIQCYKVLAERRCANVTCPEPKALNCPIDSVATKPYTPVTECCPTVPSYCTCNFNRCADSCPNGKRKYVFLKSKGEPGSCCDIYVCVF